MNYDKHDLLVSLSDELKDLRVKIIKLTNFLLSSDSECVNQQHKDLLVAQQSAMLQTALILQERISLLNGVKND
jgi:hypothetical protein